MDKLSSWLGKMPGTIEEYNHYSFLLLLLSLCPMVAHTLVQAPRSTAFPLYWFVKMPIALCLIV